jgi:hypothetical protein
VCVTREGPEVPRWRHVVVSGCAPSVSDCAPITAVQLSLLYHHMLYHVHCATILHVAVNNSQASKCMLCGVFLALGKRGGAAFRQPRSFGEQAVGLSSRVLFFVCRQGALCCM